MFLTADSRLSWLLNLGGIVFVVVLEAGAAQSAPAKAPAIAAGTTVLALGWLGLAATLRAERSLGVDLFLLSLVGAACVALEAATPAPAPIVGSVVAVLSAVSRLQERASGIFAAVLLAAFTFATAYGLGPQPLTLLGDSAGIAFAYAAGLSTVRLRREEARSRALLEELRATRDTQLEAAAIAERSRIAREIHDVLAHTLSALAVQLEGARLLLERSESDGEARGAVERAHRLALEGLGETRSAVSALRGDRVPGPSELRELVAEFEQDSGTSASLEISGAQRPLEPDASLALYRTAQEALTNVRKHARAAAVHVSLAYAAAGTELEVLDTGGAPAAPSEGGYGLTGMRERAELLGGTLDAGPTPDGFRVRLWLPS